MMGKRFFILLVLFCVTTAQGKVNIQINTNYGVLDAELYDKKAPITVKNFLSYIKSGHYNGTIFHRVIKNFMIQGGGYDTNLNKKNTKSAIKNEADNGLKNTIGTLAMARTGDPHSATAQFFINVAENKFLNHTNKSGNGWGYAVFGKINPKSMPVIAQMKAVQVKKNGAAFGNLPIQNLIINSIIIKK